MVFLIPTFVSLSLTDDRDDLEEFCLDQVEAGLNHYLTSTNGNPIVYDTVRPSKV